MEAIIVLQLVQNIILLIITFLINIFFQIVFILFIISIFYHLLNFLSYKKIMLI